jgi:HEAT repeat protein
MRSSLLARLWRPGKAAILVAVVLLGGGALWCLRGGLGTLGHRAPLAYRFVPGQRLVYRLEYASNAAVDLTRLDDSSKTPPRGAEPPGLGRMHAYQTTLKGELIATVFESSGDHILLAYRLADVMVQLEVDGVVADTAAATLQADLGRDLIVRIDPRGRVVCLYFDPAVTPQGQTTMRTLLALCQFVLPTAPSATSRVWEAEEEDRSGPYVAQYEAEDGSGQAGTLATFVKTKTGYERVRRSPAEVVDLRPTVQPEGWLIARFDTAAGHLTSLGGTGGQTLLLSGQAIACEEYRLRLDYQEEQCLAPDALAGLRGRGAARTLAGAGVPLWTPGLSPAQEDALQREALGDATLDSLRADLARAEASPDPKDDHTSLYLKLKALVHLHPESCERLGGLLATAPGDGLTLRLLAGALSDAANPACQMVLIHAIGARAGDWPALSHLIPALGAVPAPLPEAERVLRDLAGKGVDWKVASTAQLALGNMARRLAKTSPPRARGLVAWALEALRSAPSDARTRQLLLVLGNTGAAEALPAIRSRLQHPATEVRAAAALALRWIDLAEAEALLIRALGTDPEPAVRTEAAVALGFRAATPAMFEALRRALQEDSAGGVRQAVLNDLWRAWTSIPAARDLIAEAAAHDAAPEVRDMARKILETLGEEPSANLPAGASYSGETIFVPGRVAASATPRPLTSLLGETRTARGRLPPDTHARSAHE